MSNKELITKLNRNVANLQVLYVKLHNYHWNVQGPQFFSLHQLTEGYYDHIAEQYDAVAERILQLGAKPLTSMEAYLQQATLKEESRDSFTPSDIMEALISDFSQLKKEFQEISDLASRTNDTTTVALADENVAWFEKAIWMLNASK